MVEVTEIFKTKREAQSYARFVRKEHPVGKIIDGAKLESVSVRGTTVFMTFRYGFKSKRVVKQKKFGLFGA